MVKISYDFGWCCKPHSIRSAVISKAKSSMVPIDDILRTAGWSSERTFTIFYDKKIDNTSTNISSFVIELSDSRARNSFKFIY